MRGVEDIVADMLVAIVLILISLFTIVMSLMMPIKGVTFLVAPGFFPIIVASMLMIFALVLLVRCIKQKKFKEKLNINWKSEGTKNLMFVIASIAVFLFILIPVVGFLPASWIFLVVFCLCMRETKPVSVFISSTVTVFLVWLVFFYLLKVPYPKYVLSVLFS